MNFFSRSKNVDHGLDEFSQQLERSPIFPEPDEVRQFKEIETQRSNWKSYLNNRQFDSSESWLWQYWKDESRVTNQVQKKILSIFSTRVRNQKKVKSLIRNGIPPEYRGKVWWICSGGSEKMASCLPHETYSSILDHLSEVDGDVLFDIEKDLKRTLPSVSWVQSEDGLCSLRRLLQAYAYRNPSIGYCQSMNYLAAILLLHMPEENAFWAMASLIEDILPFDYYDPSMIGGRVDQQVFHSLVAWKLPEIHSLLKATETNLDPVLCPWFLCAYLNVLPLYTVCRIWDCLLWEGSMVLFRIGIAMVRSKADQLLSSGDMMSIYMILKSSSGRASSASYQLESCENDHTETGNSSSSSQTLLLLAYDRHFLGTFPRKKINSLRSKFRNIILEKDKASFGIPSNSIARESTSAPRSPPRVSRSSRASRASVKTDVMMR